jgi:hypothetical protein
MPFRFMNHHGVAVGERGDDLPLHGLRAVAMVHDMGGDELFSTTTKFDISSSTKSTSCLGCRRRHDDDNCAHGGNEDDM